MYICISPLSLAFLRGLLPASACTSAPTQILPRPKNNRGCEKVCGCFVVPPEPKEISKFVVRKTFYALTADICLTTFRQIGSRCISALFVPKTGLSQIFHAHGISGGFGGGGWWWWWWSRNHRRSHEHGKSEIDLFLERKVQKCNESRSDEKWSKQISAVSA